MAFLVALTKESDVQQGGTTRGWVGDSESIPASISSLYLKLSAELVEKAPVLHLSTAGQRTILENYLRFKCKENQEVETLKNINPKPESCLRDKKLSTVSQTFYLGKLLSFKGNRMPIKVNSKSDNFSSKTYRAGS